MKEMIAEILKEALKKKDIKLEGIENLIEIPSNPELGDFAFPCFVLSKNLKQPPHEIALELRSAIGNPAKEIERIDVAGAYINFFAGKVSLIEKTINEILTQKENFGKRGSGKSKQTKMIEFSQANTHKAFHVGHIRGTSIGESLSRISEFLGEKIIRANYQGDTGMHVAKWLWCYWKYHQKEELVDDEAWIASVYVDAVKRLEKSPKLKFEVEEINRRLDLGIDNELNKIWKKTRKLSLDALEKIYRELNTKFDVYYFESEMEARGKEISKKLVDKKIAEVSEGAVIMNLEKYNMGVWVLLRRDGTVLYSAKDLALIEKKFESFKLDKSIYVVANEQDLHMKQLLKTLELMGKKEWMEKTHHVSFGVVRLPTGKMSSRTGDNILYSDFLKEVTEYAKKRIKERSKKILKRELERRALTVSIAAIKYAMLKQGPNKNIIFKKEDALNFEGDTGVYILYSFARANSILEKLGRKKISNELDGEKIAKEEFELIKKLSQFPGVVIKAYETLNPSGIANYSYELAKAFNEFYHACPVIGSENEMLRKKIVQAFKIILKSSLNLLGIDTLEEM